MSPSHAARFLSEAEVPNKGVISMDGHDNVGQVLTASTSPIQCGGNPWEIWWRDTRGGEEADEATILAAYLATELGVEVVFSWSRLVARAVCMACSCPRGDRLTVVVKGDDDAAAKLATVGFEPM